MQINSALSYTPQSSTVISSDRSSRLENNSDRLRVDGSTRKSSQSNSSKQQTRFEVDEQAITLLEKNNVEPNPSLRGESTTDYDQPTQTTRLAVLTYQSVDNLAQRQSIEQTFGVDLYA